MPLDTTYDQLLRMLSARGLEWLRQRIMDIPDPIELDHPDVMALAQTARLAPVMSGLRGHLSPLEDIATRRLTSQIVTQASGRVLLGDQDSRACAVVLAGELVSTGDPIWRLAKDALSSDPALSLADRIAMSTAPDRDLIVAAEEILCAPVPEEVLSAARINEFAWILMQVYRFGAVRPRFTHARVYGEAYANALRFADWARRKGQVTAMAQMVYCLRLIDAEINISDLMAEIIGSQRPDGSFPEKTGFSNKDQDFQTGLWPTLMAVAALNMVTWRRWRGRDRPAPLSRPLSACRDRFAAMITPNVSDWAKTSSRDQRIALAAAMTRATGQNWFARCGLRRVAPDANQLERLANALFGDVLAVRHAHESLDLARHWPDGRETDPAMRWLRRSPVILRQSLPVDLERAWAEAVDQGDIDAFDQCCRQAALCQPGQAGAAIRAAAGRHAMIALTAAEDAVAMDAWTAAGHLQRLCVMSSLFEVDGTMAAAA